MVPSNKDSILTPCYTGNIQADALHAQSGHYVYRLMATEAEDRREPTQHGVLSSLAGGDLIRTVMGGPYSTMHRGEKGRGEIGGAYLPSRLERTPQLCS